MSVRPREGRENPARGGDGPRLRWSESPIPRPGKRRIPTIGWRPVRVAGRASWDPNPVAEDGVMDIINPGTTRGWTPTR